MASGLLLLARVAVIDEHAETAAVLEQRGDAAHAVDCGEIHLDAAARLRMNAEAINVIKKLAANWCGGFNKASLLVYPDPDFTFCSNDVHRKCVEELVSKNDDHVTQLRLGFFDGGVDGCVLRGDVTTKALRLFIAEPF